MSMITSAFAEVLAWIEKSAPGGRKDLHLRGPAHRHDIERLEDAIGLRLPQDAKELWLLHDGQEDDEIRLLPARWLSVAECEVHWHDLLAYVVDQDERAAEDPRLLDCVYHPRRIPFAASPAEVDIYLDFQPGPRGHAGQLILPRAPLRRPARGRLGADGEANHRAADAPPDQRRAHSALLASREKPTVVRIAARLMP